MHDPLLGIVRDRGFNFFHVEVDVLLERSPFYGARLSENREENILQFMEFKHLDPFTMGKREFPPAPFYLRELVARADRQLGVPVSFS